MILQFVINGLVVGCIYALVSLGLGLTYKTYGFFNLAHAAAFAIAPYALYGVLKHANAPVWLSLPLCVLVVIAFSATCHAAVFQPLRRRAASSLSLLLGSTGILFTCEGLLALLFGLEPVTLPGQEVTAGFNFIGARVTKTQVLIFALTAIICFFWWLGSKKTKYGLFMRAIASDETLARVMGLKTSNLIKVGLIVSSVTVGVAGILKGYDTGISPMMGFEVLFAAVVAVVIGGGDVQVEVGAAFSLGVVQQLAVLVVPTQWQNVIVFLILLIFLLARPHPPDTASAAGASI